MTMCSLSAAIKFKGLYQIFSTQDRRQLRNVENFLKHGSHKRAQMGSIKNGVACQSSQKRQKERIAFPLLYPRRLSSLRQQIRIQKRSSPNGSHALSRFHHRLPNAFRSDVIDFRNVGERHGLSAFGIESVSKL